MYRVTRILNIFNNLNSSRCWIVISCIVKIVFVPTGASSTHLAGGMGETPSFIPLTLPTAFWKQPYFPLSCSRLCNYIFFKVEHRTTNRAYICCLQVTSRRSLAICKLPRSLAFQAMHSPVRVRRMIACQSKHPPAKVCQSAHSCSFGCFKSQMPFSTGWVFEF